MSHNTSLDGVEQILVAEWLRQELNRARLHCPHGHRDVAVGGDKDNRPRLSRLDQLALQVQAALPGHANVQNDAAGGILQRSAPELLSRRKRAHLKVNRAYEAIEGFANRLVVIDDNDDRFVTG